MAAGGGVMWVAWYATVFRQETLALSIAEVAPIALRYGASRYAVQRNLDDRYRITQITWCNDREDWYRYWDGPEMIEFRAANTGRFQIPINYWWHEEIAAGELGPEVPLEAQEPEPEPTPQAAV